MTCGQRIRQEREKRRMSQEDLAERLEVSRQAVSKWESDASRPTKEKRERLSELFELPIEAWDEPPGGEQAGLRRWKTATAVLAAALCLIIAGNFALFFAAPRSVNTEKNPPAEAVQGAEDAEIADLSAVFPETLELSRRRDYEFGNQWGRYDMDNVPLLKDSEWFQNHNHEVGSFKQGNASTVLELFWADPREENETILYSVYLLYAIPDADGICDWQILFCIEENLREEWVAAIRSGEFTNVLGYDGFRIEIEDRELSVTSVYYIISGPDGVPRLMSLSVGSDTVEFDVDEDGEKEIVTVDGFRSSYWEITDTVKGEEGAFVYTLNMTEDSVFDLRFAPEMGGFVLTDDRDAALARYILRDGALIRVPITDFSVLDYPDVAGTEIQFITDEDILSDGKEPDDVLYSPGGVRITHRQQAYLALQELYGLTGLTVDRCYCAANEFGVIFSLLPDGFNQRGFFRMHFREEYGGSSIPSIYIFWRELGNDWSPLSFAEAERPESWVPESEVLRWYYERLNILNTGEAAYAGMVYASFDALYLTNGDLYLGEARDTEWGPALFRITGPYPGGEVHH